MKDFITDNNRFLADGVTPNPNFGLTTVIDYPEPAANLDARMQRRAMVRGRAAELDKKGKYSEASALRATIGE